MTEHIAGSMTDLKLILEQLANPEGWAILNKNHKKILLSHIKELAEKAAKYDDLCV